MIASTRIATAQTDVASLLKSHPFIRFDRTSPTGAKVEQTLRRMRIKPKEILEVNSVAAIKELVPQPQYSSRDVRWQFQSHRR
jgi:hypothetical protein